VPTIARQKAPKRTVVRTKPQLAAEIDRGVRQITEYLQRGMPREPGGGYCVEDCQAWIEANIRPTGRGDESDEQSQRAYWEEYKVREQALLEELKRKREEGKLVEIEPILNEWKQHISEARSLLEALPDRLVAVLPDATAAKVRKRIRAAAVKVVDEALNRLADLLSDPAVAAPESA
jgi:phage terminase Nu1 subunit (DNA packaging protein)